MRAVTRIAAVTLTLALASGLAAQESAFQGEAIETFLKDGKIVSIRDLGTGITRPQRATIEHDGRRNDAVFKSVDIRRQGATTLEDGTVEVGFRDTWETEVAAYRLDTMIGLGMVPATVERRIGPDVGSLQWWVESRMSEAERLQQGIAAPDAEDWNRQMFKVRLFDQLILNTDRHARNMLVTADFQVRLIDHSRAFRERSELPEPQLLQRFSRSLLDGIATLTEDGLKDEIGRYLSNGEIERLLERRDAILELAKARVAEHGEAAVIYP